MATGEDHPSMSGDSEEIFESECFNCSQDGKHVEAEVFCVECGDNLCRGCLNDHNKIARLRTHHIQDKSAVKPGTTLGALHPPTEKCLRHHGRLIDTYCTSHDVVCCSVCVSVDHKSCPDMKYIPTAATGISNSKELQEIQSVAKSTKAKLDGVKHKRLQNREHIRKQRSEALEGLNEAKDKLIKCIEDLADATNVAIMEKYDKFEDAIVEDLDELNKLIDCLEDTQDQLHASQNDETKLFVHVKQNKEMISAATKLVEKCSADIGDEFCTFETDETIETYLKGLASLGSFGEGVEYSAQHMFDKNLKSTTDKSDCHLTGMCSLDTGEMVVADYDNVCLKKLNTSLQIEDRCVLPDNPWDVCQISPTVLAVSLIYKKKIQYVSLGRTMSLGSLFTPNGEGSCTGIAYRSGKLYLNRKKGGKNEAVLQVYDMNGTLLQTIEKDTKGDPILGVPRGIIINDKLSCICIADEQIGLIILDKSGRLLNKVTDPELKNAFGICCLPGNALMVCGNNSHNVIQFDSHGKKVTTLLQSSDGLKDPVLLYFDSKNSRLIVAFGGRNNLKVFRVKKK